MGARARETQQKREGHEQEDDLRHISFDGGVGVSDKGEELHDSRVSQL